MMDQYATISWSSSSSSKAIDALLFASAPLGDGLRRPALADLDFLPDFFDDFEDVVVGSNPVTVAEPSSERSLWRVTSDNEDIFSLRIRRNSSSRRRIWIDLNGVER